MEPSQQPQMPDYMEEYNTFVSNYKLTEVSAEEIGHLIIKMTSYYGKYNMKLKGALRDYSIVMRDFQTQVDPSTGKGISSAKAEVMAAATEVAANYEGARIDIGNIEQYINGMKALQKGVLSEYAHS